MAPKEMVWRRKHRCVSSMAVLVLVLVSGCFGSCESRGLTAAARTEMEMVQTGDVACEEIYVVREEGESLQTISEKCGDPYILEENPQINDPDDVFPGLVIKITPSQFHHTVSGFIN